MADFFIAMLTAGVQLVLLRIALVLIREQKQRVAIPVILLKFIIYAVAISVLFKRFYPHIFRCFTGYIAGLPIFAVLMFLVPFIIKICRKKN